MKRFLVGTLGLFVIIGLGLFVWAKLPISQGNTADPAALFANQQHPDKPPFEEGYFTYEGQTLHFMTAGEGEAVLMLHGFPAYWYSLIRQANDLRTTNKVILLDGLGAGRSSAPADIAPYQLDRMAAHLIALLDDMNISRTHLVGHDWGAAMMFGIAQAYPDRVLSVTGISAPPQNIMLQQLRDNPAQQEASGYMSFFKGMSAPLLLVAGGPNRFWEGTYQTHIDAERLTEEEGQFFKAALSDPKRLNAHINWYRANVPDDYEFEATDFWPNEAARLTVPAQLIWGKNDTAFLPDFIKSLEEQSDHLRIIQFEGVGHWPHLERAQEVTAAIRSLMTAPAP